MKNSIKFKCILAFAIGQLIMWSTAHAALTLDRTRAVYHDSNQTISLHISNDNKTYPFLAQVWIEDEHGKKIEDPLLALPPLQRIEPGEQSLVRVTKLTNISQLPQDRESLFYFNLREIPPKPEGNNVLQIAIQTRIKLFYRPALLPDAQYDTWQEQLIFRKQGNNQFIIENPTPYYITISNITRNGKKIGGGELGNFNAVMVAPKSTEQIKLTTNQLSSFYISYINDFGGHPELRFHCNNSVCTAAQS